MTTLPNETIRIEGMQAIEYAEAHGLKLSMYTSPIEEARDGLDPSDARAIAHEDASLIYLDRPATTAERIAAQLGNDGQIFRAADNRTLEEMCEEAGAAVSKARVRYDDESESEVVEEVSRGESLYDRIRYTFRDGSAIVVAGDAWDFEGADPFSWAGA